MTLKPRDILLLTIAAVVLWLPSTEPSQPDDSDDVTPVVVERDLLDVAEDEFRASLAKLLRVYADEDLKDSQVLKLFEEEIVRAQEKSFGPVGRAVYDSRDLRETAQQLEDHTLGLEQPQ